MQVEVGCGQITWGRDVPEDEVLADIARAGYAGAPFPGRSGRSAAQIKHVLERHGLRPAPGYFSGELWDADGHDDFVARARQYAATSAELGVTEMYLAVGGFGRRAPSGRTRAEAAGHVRPEDSLDDREFAQLATTVEAIGRATLEHGVRSCFHSHVGTFVETGAEIDRLLGMVDPQVLFLGPDTGHLAWAGVDVVAFTRRHADRIKTMHVKDIVAEVRDRAVAGEWDYRTAQEHGIWTEIGEGCVDFPATLRALEDAGFTGWLIVETDVTQKPTALDSAAICRRNLRALGV